MKYNTSRRGASIQIRSVGGRISHIVRYREGVGRLSMQKSRSFGSLPDAEAFQQQILGERAEIVDRMLHYRLRRKLAIEGILHGIWESMRGQAYGRRDSVQGRPRTAPLSPFGEMLVALCRARSLSVYRLGLQLGITGRSRMAKVVSRRDVSGSMLSLEQLFSICELLHLSKSEASALILLGLRELTPEPMLVYIDHLEEMLAHMEESAGDPSQKG